MQATAVQIGDRALILEGPPGSGKSSLALALIDRGAMLIGDDGVSIRREQDQIIASPPPNIRGSLEVRGLGLFTMPVVDAAPVGLILTLGEQGERLPGTIPKRDIIGLRIPVLPFLPGAIAPAVRAEYAMSMYSV
ncbi:HPr kinase/phosphatase C-terminal domain-containing protein [Erythrobacter sp. F6033]|uniref:HPr kinase/phosphorylase n=1 Tax=Erythrobacter sp. F6033 TaxID=2926401 RepID=UPI001FF5C3C7|nr:HPr kinase/phosphatase C-terminal domain-containing protein [Erythrobacter sp. F6033]MCK0128943.1 HPr kinase/phosphatase C-terminal domain-containing protein [Erythrobacter sp. F6033]